MHRWRLIRRTARAFAHLVGGLVTALLALGALIVTMLALLAGSLMGRAAPTAFGAVHAVANRERARLSRWGPAIAEPGPSPTTLWSALRDHTVRRELAWAAVHGTAGLVLAAVGLSMPIYAVENLTFPLWYQLLPPGTNGPGMIFWQVRDLPGALVVALIGAGWLVLAVVLGPGVARLHGWPGRRLLTPSADTDLSLRIAELTATRAAALDAHAAELRRIERSLHDGAQNRLVAVNVLLGLARRALVRDPAAAGEALERAQDATERALAELRTVVRSILPPVLAERGLTGALAGLAGGSVVPCHLDVRVDQRCAASVEATAYFVVAEALTNVTKHSGAHRVAVTVCRERSRLVVVVQDDGHGGAAEDRGSGLPGIRRRVEAFDGVFSLTSPVGGPTTMRVELPCGS